MSSKELHQKQQKIVNQERGASPATKQNKHEASKNHQRDHMGRNSNHPLRVGVDRVE